MSKVYLIRSNTPCHVSTILIIFYYIVIQIFLPTALLYWLLKLISEILNRRWTNLFDNWFKIVDQCTGLILIINSILIIYFIFFYNIINIINLFKIGIFIWWLGRIIHTLWEYEGRCIPFGNFLNSFLIEIHNSYKNRIIGLNYYLIFIQFFSYIN